MPKQILFFEFPSVKSSKNFHSTDRILWDTNFVYKHEKSRVIKDRFFDFCNVFSNRCERTGLVDFPEKRAPTKVKHLVPVCQVSWNFTEGNAKKFTISFAFCAHVDVIKYRKTLTFSFDRAQIT